MPLHVSKLERLDGADRNDLALAALEACRAARTTPGVTSSRFYWVNPNEIAILTDAEPGHRLGRPRARASVSPVGAGRPL